MSAGGDLLSPGERQAAKAGLGTPQAGFSWPTPRVPLSPSVFKLTYLGGRKRWSSHSGLRPVSICPLCSRTFSLALVSALVRGGCFLAGLDERGAPECSVPCWEVPVEAEKSRGPPPASPYRVGPHLLDLLQTPSLPPQ